MCWPQIVGGVEIEERRPRTLNEPRRKRLNFVRGHRHDSDEWAVNDVSSRRLTEREIWDRQRARAMHPISYHQFHGHHDPRMVQMPHAQPQLHHVQPSHHGHHPGFDQHGHHGHCPQLDRDSHHSDNEIIETEELGHDGHDGHDSRDHFEPRIIPIKPPKSQLPKGLRTHAKKSGTHKNRYSISSSSSDGSSSLDRLSGFSEGFRAGRRSLSRNPVPRGRSTSRLTDDSFEDLMHSRLRSRSRRGRRY